MLPSIVADFSARYHTPKHAYRPLLIAFCINKRGGFGRDPPSVGVQLRRQARSAMKIPSGRPLVNKKKKKFACPITGHLVDRTARIKADIQKHSARLLFLPLQGLAPLDAPVNSMVPGLNYPLIGGGDQLRGVISFVFRLSFLHRWQDLPEILWNRSRDLFSRRLFVG